ncbi:hypothetical protein [Helicobacter sp. 13S00482-2]|uniref:hypothetical protein n=1 Tax=Helicobacter sp. 13S00482-2 TaxID=1476200 RepID=UPI0015DAD4DC|nr:hypothetical protein [Helicobacter sp. 13S00482-2]
MLKTYAYKMYEDDEIEGEDLDDEYQDYGDDRDGDTPLYNGYDDDDYQNADEEYEEE